MPIRSGESSTASSVVVPRAGDRRNFTAAKLGHYRTRLYGTLKR